jgi:hypothetical protein
MEGTITKHASVAASLDTLNFRYGKNDTKQSLSRSFPKSFKFQTEKERLQSKAPVVASLGAFKPDIQLERTITEV